MQTFIKFYLEIKQNAKQKLHNVKLHFLKFFWGGAQPLPRPLPIGEGAHPPPQTSPPGLPPSAARRVAFGDSTFSPPLITLFLFQMLAAMRMLHSVEQGL